MIDIQSVIEKYEMKLNEMLKASDMYLRYINLNDQLAQYNAELNSIEKQLKNAENNNDYIKVVELEQKKETTKKAILIVEDRLSKINLSSALSHNEVKNIIDDFTNEIDTIIENHKISCHKVAIELLALNKQAKEYNNEIYKFGMHLQNKYHYTNALNSSAKYSSDLELQLHKIIANN